MKILIAGKNGQLGQEFARVLTRRSIAFLAPEEAEFDITDAVRIGEIVSSIRPDVIINCAAYNLVDRAEEDRDAAFRINATGPQLLAQAAQAHRAKIVHFGSDYVFDGRKENALYGEDDNTNPLNEYGRSKLAGERLVRSAAETHLVLRLSWVYGAGKQNFVHKLLEWEKKSEYLKIACDEFSVPTSTATIVDTTLHALAEGVTGLFHLTNSGFCSRYEWGRLVLATLGINKFVRPVSMDTFKLPANRPKFSAMTNKSLAGLLGRAIPAWDEAVVTFLRERE